MSLQFQKTVEDFTCTICGFEVSGSGYTNHCPECLWSKHVDISPGDRSAVCGGMMKPVQVMVKGKEYSLRHVCEKCGFERINKTQKEDNFDTVIQISAEHAKNV
jgi:rubrerythrin